MTDFTGKRVGQYQVIRKIGEGGMGQVYLARQESIGREVAIKFIVDRAANIAEFAERFEREVKICASLNHAHIIKVFDYGRAPNVAAAYIVMEYLKGGSLADIIHSKRPLPLTTVVELFEQIASALDYAHSKDIIHRDLKPLNVLIDEGRNAYISDFGLAKLRTASSLTNTGAMMGTAAYMSPEQWKGKPPLDQRADIYSLGIMLFEMITGQLPFDAETMENMLYLHLFEPLPQINKVRTDVPPAVQQVIENATAKDRNQRTSSCRDILSELKKALAPISPISQAIEIQIMPQIEAQRSISDEIEQVSTWDGSVDLPRPTNPEDEVEMVDKLLAAGVPRLTATLAPYHGNAWHTQKLIGIEKAYRLIEAHLEKCAPEDKAMWKAKYDAKGDEYSREVCSFNMPINDTRPIYMADHMKKKRT